MKNLKLNNRVFKGGMYALLFCVLNLFSNQASAQCSNCNANYPAGTFSTTSASLTTVNTCIYGGEYSNYSVTAGETYTWTTCGDASFDTELTLTSGGCGGTFLAYNDDDCGLQSTITWTAGFTGIVTLLVSEYGCDNFVGCMTVQWACTTCGATPPPDYIMPTVGINNEYVGACLVTDCGPSTFTDDGGPSGNYSNGINQIYRVFCPDAAGQCMKVTFNRCITQNSLDFLLVGNGPTQNSPAFTTFPNSPTAYAGITGLWGNLNPATPFSFTSTDASGCLTFRFYSSGAGNNEGWNTVLECVPCAGGPNGTDNNDCINLTPLCSGATIGGNATGPGILAEGCNGSDCPAGGENHTNWYTFTAQTSGTIDFTINPQTNSDDYDYAVYGPNVTCAALGAPLNCSDAGVTGNTGVQNVSPNEWTEDVTGNGFTESINATAGDSYILVIDEWTPTGSGYDLSFGGTASLDCSVLLPVELSSFTAEYAPEYDVVDLLWVTESERDNDYFEVERSIDGITFETINTVKGVGNTNYQSKYYSADENPVTGVNYYRLKQFDMNGTFEYSEVVSVNILDDFYDMLSLFPNPTTGKTEVIFNSYTNDEVMLNVVGYQGKTIVNSKIDAVSGGNRFTLDLSNEPQGVYIVSITSKDKVYRSKLIKK